MTPKYRWSSPYEWLANQAEGWTEKELRRKLIVLAAGLENDAIQDMYEVEMVEDGYFDELAMDIGCLGRKET